ncbi:MAG: translocation/assembly module TamB domain-containing protein, partial [Prevotella sp.]
MRTTDVKLDPLLGDTGGGSLSADITFSGILPDSGAPSLTADAKISRLCYNGYCYKDINLQGIYDNNVITGNLQISDPSLTLGMEGKYNLSNKGKQDISIKALLSDFSPSATRLTDRWGNARFRASIDANLKASCINDAEGYLSLTGFSMTSDTVAYTIDNIFLKSGYEADGTHFLSFAGDFGSASLHGSFDHSTLYESIMEALRRKIPAAPWLPQHRLHTDNHFTLHAWMSNTDWLEKIFQIPFRLNGHLELKAGIDDTSGRLGLHCTTPAFVYDGTRYENCAFHVSSSQEDTLRLSLSLTTLTEKGTRPHLQVDARAAEGLLLTTLTWDNRAARRASGILHTSTNFLVDAITGEASALIGIKPSEIRLGDTTWDILPATITYRKDNVVIDHFAARHGEQHIIIDGIASKDVSDSLIVDINDLDIEYVLEMVNFHSVDFGGKATGKALILAPFGDFSASAKLNVKEFTFENGHMGTLYASVDWDKTEKQINIDALADDGPEALTLINGYVSPSRNFIDLDIKAQGTSIDFMHSFTGSFLHDIKGQTQGMVTLAGPLNNINLTGELIVNGEATMTPTNCKYFMTNDTIRFIPDDIILPNVPIIDTYNHKGILSGGIHHRHLTNLSYDLYIDADNLLAFNTHEFGEDGFYGTVFGTGNVAIHGRSGELRILIDITPQKNSTFTYNASNPDAISNREFITWHDVTPSADDSLMTFSARNLTIGNTS